MVHDYSPVQTWLCLTGSGRGGLISYIKDADRLATSDLRTLRRVMISFSFDWEYMPDELIGEIMSAFADSREVLFDGQLQIVVEMEDGDFSFWHLCQEEENCPGRGRKPTLRYERGPLF